MMGSFRYPDIARVCDRVRLSALRGKSWALPSDYPNILSPLEHKGMYANVSLMLCGFCGIVQDIQKWV
jgi:hypothetical protein